MLKISMKIILVLALTVFSIFMFKNRVVEDHFYNYKPLIVSSDEDKELLITNLDEMKVNSFYSSEDITLPITNYSGSEELTLDEIKKRVDPRDYRYSPLVDVVSTFFQVEDGEIIYIDFGEKDLLSLFSFYNDLTNRGVAYTIVDLTFYRGVLNFASLILILILFSIGCRKRFLLSLVTGVLSFFFMNPYSFNSFLFFVTIYFALIMFIENFSFTNPYIKRNNIGFFRLLLFYVLIVMPTLLPTLLYSDKNIPMVKTGGEEISYDSLSRDFHEKTPNLSSLFAHYTYQKTLIYGNKYLFPTYNSSVKINEFVKSEYSLEHIEKEVFRFDQTFLNDFLKSAEQSSLGELFLSFGSSFTLKSESLLSLYILEREYMQICILAVIILITFFLFRKRTVKL